MRNPASGAGQRQEVVHQLAHPAGFAGDVADRLAGHLHPLRCGFPGIPDFFQQVDVAANRGERCAQLVGRVGHEPPLGRVGFLQLAVRAFQARQHFVQRVRQPADFVVGFCAGNSQSQLRAALDLLRRFRHPFYRAQGLARQKHAEDEGGESPGQAAEPQDGPQLREEALLVADVSRHLEQTDRLALVPGEERMFVHQEVEAPGFPFDEADLRLLPARVVEPDFAPLIQIVGPVADGAFAVMKIADQLHADGRRVEGAGGQAEVDPQGELGAHGQPHVHPLHHVPQAVLDFLHRVVVDDAVDGQAEHHKEHREQAGIPQGQLQAHGHVTDPLSKCSRHPAPCGSGVCRRRLPASGGAWPRRPPARWTRRCNRTPTPGP